MVLVKYGKTTKLQWVGITLLATAVFGGGSVFHIVHSNIEEAVAQERRRNHEHRLRVQAELNIKHGKPPPPEYLEMMRRKDAASSPPKTEPVPREATA
mmetsp:Transcript_8713/g.17023  ORF Transcript_8713/g.17023 Transcript_8713/m.17023 type:complete len:98 (-) Transcript_8713:129-422(-)